MTFRQDKDLVSRWSSESTEVNTSVKISNYKRLVARYMCRHKVFISYYHNDDQAYRDEFEKRYGHLFIPKSVKLGDIDSDLSDEYIKRLIRENYITDSSVIVVLVGPNTKLRKHVDWEISAGLSNNAGDYSGLIAFLLPTFPFQPNPSTGNLDCYRFSDLPDRLADNVRSGYAGVYLWPERTASDVFARSAVEEAFLRRETHANLIQNSRAQMPSDRTCQSLRDPLTPFLDVSAPGGAWDDVCRIRSWHEFTPWHRY